MFTKYVLRGMTAGLVAGVAFGLFIALVQNPLIGYAETFETGAKGHGPVVSGVITASVSIAGGILVGILLGAVFLGAAFYFLEPAIPGTGATKSYLLAAAGFITLSGAPWLVLPPQPPGVEQGLTVGTRLTIYGGMMLAGALACGAAGYLFNRLRPHSGRVIGGVAALIPFGSLLLVAFVAPANTVSGAIPEALADVFRAVTVVGQLALWLVLASAHAWFMERVDRAGVDERTEVSGAGGKTTVG